MFFQQEGLRALGHQPTDYPEMSLLQERIRLRKRPN